MPMPPNLDTMVAAGKLGKKSGAGFYEYKKGKAVKNKHINYSDIKMLQDRLIYRLLNESVACYRESLVENDEMIDAGVIFGTGFAPFRGGPVQHMRDTGIETLINNINQFEKSYGERFKADSAWASLQK